MEFRSLPGRAEPVGNGAGRTAPQDSTRKSSAEIHFLRLGEQDRLNSLSVIARRRRRQSNLSSVDLLRDCFAVARRLACNDVFQRTLMTMRHAFPRAKCAGETIPWKSLLRVKNSLSPVIAMECGFTNGQPVILSDHEVIVFFSLHPLHSMGPSFAGASSPGVVLGSSSRCLRCRSTERISPSRMGRIIRVTSPRSLHDSGFDRHEDGCLPVDR